MESTRAIGTAQVKAGIDASIKGIVDRAYFDAICDDESEIDGRIREWNEDVAESDARSNHAR